MTGISPPTDPGLVSPRSAGWTTQRLAEFVSAISVHMDRESAIRIAIDRITDVTQSEAGAIIHGGELLGYTGFADAGPSLDDLLAIVDGHSQKIGDAGGSECRAIAIPIDGAGPDHLILACRRAPLGRPESDLLRAAVRVLLLTLRSIETTEAEREQREISERRGAENEQLLNSLRERQRLFERLSRIQSSIVSRLEIADVLQGIVDGAAELLGDQTVALRLIDRDDPSRMAIVASHGISDDQLRGGRYGRVGQGAGGRAISEEKLVVIEGYGEDPSRINHWASYGVRSAMGTPVREGGRVVGSLVVARETEDHAYSAAEREILVAFAKHASIALTDARTVEDAIDQALHDPLTKLPNRTMLADRLAGALTRAKVDGSRVAVLFCDLDQFKTVNDSLGHAVGDELLVAVGERLLSSIRPTDTAARFGGDEFAVLLEDATGVDVPALADRILRSLEKPFGIREKVVHLSGSIGIAIGSEPENDLLRDADLAMYRAKRGGAGRYVTFEPYMHASVVERLELEAELKQAVVSDQLEVHYQPIFELPLSRLVGVEALVRWSHPTRGMLAPGEFVRVAEETGAILKLGRSVLRVACMTMAGWQQAYPMAGPLTVSVNVSVVQLERPGLVEEVREALRISGLAPGTLTLELTETALGCDTEQITQRLQELSDLDVELAVDDFGIGFSSLQHLQQYPIDVLKIPRPFVDGLGGDGDDSALTRAIIDIGQSLGLRVVAEGIERDEQLERLGELGCRFGQGYLLGRPMDVEAMAARLADETEAWQSGPSAG